MKRSKRIISYILITILLLSSVGCGSTAKKKPFNLKDGTNYTVMIYMVGSNLESEGAAASKDILEMAESGIDLKHNNVIIYAGGSQIWYLDNMMSSRNNLVQLTSIDSEPALKQIEDSIELPFGSTKNMGEEETLTKFVDYCYDNYKAKNYALILWDHGAGPIGGFGSDELFGEDSLYKIEMGEALKKTKFAREKKFGFIGFDACLMSSIEFARTLSDYSKYMVASQELEPGYGWDYSFMNKFNKTDDPVEISKEVLKKYESFYSTQTQLNDPDLTLSVLDLSKTKKIVSKMDTLFEKMSFDLSENTFSDFAMSRDSTKSFALSATGRGKSIDVVDLGDFINNVYDEYSEPAKEVKEILGDLVVSSYSNIPQSCGVSFYYPYDNKENFETMGQYLYGIDGCQNYTNFIDYFTKFWNNATSTTSDTFVDSTWDKLDAKDNQIKFHFAPEELKGIKKISYTIFRTQNSAKNVWEPICENVQVDANKNGDVLIDSTPEIFCVKGTNEESVPWNVTQVSSDKKGKLWMLNNTELQDYLSYHGVENYYNEVPINITFTEDNNGNIKVKDMLKLSDDGSLGRENIDISKFSAMKFYTNELTVTKDKKGKTKPFTEWKNNGKDSYRDTEVEIENEGSTKNPFKIEKKRLTLDSQYIQDYAIQLVVEDYNGNKRASKIRSLNQKNAFSKETKEVDGVKYTYKKYANKSVITGIETDKIEVKIPNSLGGRKVTEICSEEITSSPEKCRKVTIPKGVNEIGEEAFSGWWKLEKINVPEGVKKIKESAFESCKYLRELKLPESLEFLGHGVLKGTNVKEIKIPKNLKLLQGGALSNTVEKVEVDEENEHYTMVDDTLFTKDEKTLVYYPHKPIEYNNKTQVETIDLEVPAGCEKIGSEAIGCEQISKIVFPDTLKSIGPGAFSSCGFIKKIEFPDSLTDIGSGAFLNAIGGEVQIHIGKNINYVGPCAFKGNYISKFTVSKENKNYSELDGNITNKSKDTLIFSKTKNGKEFIVPKGIVALASSALDGVFKRYTNKDDAKSIVIPDSVVSIEKSVDGSKCERWTVGKGLRYWGDVDSSIAVRGKYTLWNGEQITISKNNPYYYVDGQDIRKKKQKVNDKITPKIISEKYK